MLTTSNKCVIITRTSTKAQEEGTSVSSEIQYKSCVSEAKKMGLIVENVVNYVHTAFKSDSSLLEETIRKYDIIMFASVDRFSRNLSRGLSIAEESLKAGKIFIFVRENLIVNNSETMKMFGEYLIKAQNESELLGVRISASKKNSKSEGLYIGGRIPYGYVKIQVSKGYKLIPHFREIKISRFIKACRESKDVKLINKLLDDVVISENVSHASRARVDLNTYVKPHKFMSYENIATILNMLDIKKRNALWKIGSVASVKLEEVKLWDEDLSIPSLTRLTGEEAYPFPSIPPTEMKVEPALNTRELMDLATRFTKLCVEIEKPTQRRIYDHHLPIFSPDYDSDATTVELSGSDDDDPLRREGPDLSTVTDPEQDGTDILSILYGSESSSSDEEYIPSPPPKQKKRSVRIRNLKNLRSRKRIKF